MKDYIPQLMCLTSLNIHDCAYDHVIYFQEQKRSRYYTLPSLPMRHCEKKFYCSLFLDSYTSQKCI